MPVLFCRQFLQLPTSTRVESHGHPIVGRRGIGSDQRLMSHKVTCTLSASALSSSCLTPFLFQTRTLCMSRYLRSSPTASSHYRSYPAANISPRRRGLRSSEHGTQGDIADRLWPEPEITSTSDDAVPNIVHYQTQSRPHDTHEEQASRRLHHVPRTSEANGAFRKGRKANRGAHRESVKEARHRRGRQDLDFDQFTQGIEFDQAADEQWHGGKDEISDLARSQPLGVSTITDSERYAFQRVFKDIFGKTQGQGAITRDDYNFVSPNTSSSVANSQSTTKSPKLSRWELEEMVNKYPVPLRAAAARAMGLDRAEEDQEELVDTSPDLDVQRLEALREPERQRVETLMNEAASDFELWDIMEREVFTLIPRLGLEDVGKSSNLVRPKTKKKKRSGTSADVVDSPSSNPLGTFAADDTGISPLALYGPLYPSHLLYGMRLLDRHFSKSSSLTLAILPKIKSLGVISHVLGASCQLYNELIQIYRYRYDNYRGVLQLLGEMEHGGIEFDQETLDIVMDIERTQASVRRGEKGEVLQVLWNLPEFAPAQFKVWGEKIAAELKRKELNRRVTVTY